MNPASAASPALSGTHSAAARTAASVLVGSLLVATCAHVSIPLWFTPIPLTLQTFAVLLLGLLLSPGAAAASLLLYLAEGAAGLPVFSPHSPGGMLHLLGPTGGYLLSYPAAAALTAFLRRRFPSSGFAPSVLTATTGSLLILLCGAAWLAFQTTVLAHRPTASVLALAVLPFIRGDLLKIAAAAGVATGLRRFRRS
jgi:biotin transport system substrate-specific component